MTFTKFQLRLLGGFELADGAGMAIALSSKKAAALLAYLAHRPGEVVSRAKIATLLWPDRGEEQARASLRQTLSVLRKALDDEAGEAVVSSAQGLAVASQAFTIDSVEFELGAEPAADLYQGPFLDGFDIRAEIFEDWLRGERARLGARAMQTFTALLEQSQERNEPGAALRHAARLLELDPLREDIHRLTMALQQQQGHWNEALRHYQTCRDILKAELGIEPEAETQRLYEEIKRGRDGAPASIIPPAPILPPAELRQADSHPAIAVMPFENLSDDPDQQFFTDGITEDIITELSRFHELFVVARNSTFSYQGRAFGLPEVGEAFDVQYVVKGSVRKAGNQVRLTAQLFEAASGKNIWAERYDRELADIFALQDELTRAIAAVLPGRVENHEARKASQKPPKDMAAYELLLAGKLHHHRYTQADCTTALDLLDRAIGLEPDYAAAYAWKACVLGQALARGYLPNPDALFKSAGEAVDTALRLDDNEVEAHRVQAEIAIVTKRLDTAVRHNERALALNPNDPRLMAQKGELLTLLGQAADGVEWLNMAMRLDPYSLGHWAHMLGAALMLSGRYEEAAAAYQQSGRARFDHHANMAGCFGKLGRSDEAASQADLALALKSDFTIADYVAGLAYRDEAERDQHREILSAAPLPQ
ncbi:MAG: hypothetical protein HOA08_07430 [Rhodospirillaceae bacterium]|nr:hypothetical protein [Rhodospirillaceae bacterium]MBT3494866.1 hypothetical protein [Rhodospirillaceae bacterium]MBT3781897.1 hypothetical protein [Rhodospirillaceae bacterium]MBT3976474.1 hypothetical protein [Rhodospirillaceae bacterium]MBT4171133.1 hypothetical protein [Rhodospirillaceae bacterium]